MDYVPEGASVVLKISDWQTLQADMAHNSLLQKYEAVAPYFFFSGKAPLLKTLYPNGNSLLCVNNLNDSLQAYTFISKNHATLFRADSLQDKTVETLKVEEQTFQRISVGKNIAYSAVVDSVFIASSSQKLLMDILNGKSERENTFKKVYNLPTNSDFTVLLKGNSVQLTDSTQINFSSWSALDVSVAPDALGATGITLATDSIRQLLNVFEGQNPQLNSAANLVPMDATEAISFTFNDAEKFQKNLRRFRGETENAKNSGIFGSANEVGSFLVNNERVAFIKSIDPSLTLDALAYYVSTNTSFREIEIKGFSEPELFGNTFSPFIAGGDANFVFPLDNFFVFTESIATAQQLIAAYQNNSTLAHTAYFKNTAGFLGSSSSLVLYKMQGSFGKDLAVFLNLEPRATFQDTSFKDFPLAALQFNFDRNFAHVVFSCREEGGETQLATKGVSEKFVLPLKNPILGSPQTFSSGNGSYVAVQDVGNELYLISETGKILWTKSLGSPILGNIEEVDIYGNGNRQMAFATQNALYVLDRNGKEVKPFPLRFKDEITQPLSVFDYDGNHKYRFVVAQDKTVLMYDKNGKRVTGFGFNKSKSPIVQPPKHIRMGNKDYIVIPEENGKLNILSRVGKPRISVNTTFEFSEVPIAEEDNTFVVISKKHIKQRIDQQGKVSSQKLDVGSNYWFSMMGNTKVTLDDNLLRVDGKLASLPLGLYTHPQLFKINGTVYITITETQEKKVYVFDKNGSLLSGFPVYGTSAASMGKGNGKNSLSIAVKGDEKAVILYTTR